MTGDVLTSLAQIGAVFAALYAAHQVGDHWVQTDVQATAKGAPGWPGRLADLRHVATLTVVKVIALVGLSGVTGWRPSLLAVAVGLGVDAVSHWWADRRHTIDALARLVNKHVLFTLGSPRPGRDDNPSPYTGAYALDQSWHLGWLYVAALIIGGVR